MYLCISHYIYTYINICIYMHIHIQSSLEQCGTRGSDSAAEKSVYNLWSALLILGSSLLRFPHLWILTNCGWCSTVVFIFKNPCISAPALFKPVMFKDQLDIHKYIQALLRRVVQQSGSFRVDAICSNSIYTTQKQTNQKKISIYGFIPDRHFYLQKYWVLHRMLLFIVGSS